MPKNRVLVVDDEDAVRKSLVDVLTDRGYEASAIDDGRKALDQMQDALWDVVLVDLKMPGMDGMEVLKEIKSSYPDTAVIIITGYGTIEGAVEAVRLGASDYVTKPFTPDEICIRVEKAIQQKRLIEENVYLKKTLDERYEFCNIIGKSKSMQVIFALIERIAPTDCSVLIQGESGTGKELIARAIHRNSLRKDGKFIAVDCGALPETLLESELFGHVKGSFTGAVVTKRGLLEVADKGSFFMDEIGDLSPGIQAKLLRVLQEKEFRQVGGIQNIQVDVRLIAATNKHIDKMIEQGTFRKDLFYRVNTVPIHIPPLRKRSEDIPLLVQHFLKRFAARKEDDVTEISPEALNMLIEYSWPGNVRELEHVIEQMVIMNEGPVIEPEQVPMHIKGSKVCFTITTPHTNDELKDLRKQMREKAVENIERAFVIEALKRNEWNVSHAAREVGLKRQNFQALMRKYHITAS
jgi:DNA-binding NtrC family response regulator